jgi:hypothetical protein
MSSNSIITFRPVAVSVNPKSRNSIMRRIELDIDRIDGLIEKLEDEVLIPEDNKRNSLWSLEREKVRLLAILENSDVSMF